MRLTGNVGEMLVNVEVKIEISMLLLDIKKWEKTLQTSPIKLGVQNES